MEKAFPNEKPAFLFDDIERSTHMAISADAYRVLKDEHDKLENAWRTPKANTRNCAVERIISNWSVILSEPWWTKREYLMNDPNPPTKTLSPLCPPNRGCKATGQGGV